MRYLINNKKGEKMTNIKSLINEITDNKLTLSQLADACEFAMNEWDV